MERIYCKLATTGAYTLVNSLDCHFFPVNYRHIYVISPPKALTSTSYSIVGELDDAEDDLTDPEDQELSNALESLDERTLDDLMAVIDVTDLDSEPEERSLLQQKNEALLYS